jgi:hypothetical protein
MDKAIIFDMFDFVSFHVGKTLLNSGIEVTGVHIDAMENIQFLDEKRLEVGRNANFVEQSWVEWENDHEPVDTNVSLIISIYDLYMGKKELIFHFKDKTKPIIEYIEQNKNNVNIVFILPVQMLTKTFKGYEIEEFLGRIKNLVSNTQFIYLPAIYGPWQPSAFLFQRAIVSEFQKEELIYVTREWTNDVLFIEDALESILEIIETEKPGSYLLESGKENQWFRCAAFLKVNENQADLKSSETLKGNTSIERVAVKKVTPIMDSMRAQMEHVKRLYANRL